MTERNGRKKAQRVGQFEYSASFLRLLRLFAAKIPFLLFL